MAETVAGMVNDFMLQPVKPLAAISVREGGSTTVVRLVQPSKAAVEINLIAHVFGKLMEVKFRQDEKEFSPINEGSSIPTFRLFNFHYLFSW